MNLTEKNKQVLIVGGILGVLVLVIVVYMGLMFVWPQIQSTKDRISRLESEIQENRAQLQEYREYLQDETARQQVEEAFARVASRLPDFQDPIEIFDLLRDYFEGTDVAFTYLEPNPQVNRDRFTEHPFTIRGSARYHEFGQLVNLIECNPERLMRVSEFNLTNNNRRPSIHPMEVGITTFTFNEN